VQRTALETERLALRQLEDADAPFILRLLNEPGFLKHIGDRGVRTQADARAYIARSAQESYRQFGFGLLAVQRKREGTPIGMCGVMQKPWLDAPDLAYAFLAEAEGRGYATEAARAVLAHARADLRMERIVAVVTAENAGSIRVLEKLGFTARGSVTDPTSETELRRYEAPATVNAEL
jgi:RimJ/RimL family protein N-acetyltransferase